MTWSGWRALPVVLLAAGAASISACGTNTPPRDDEQTFDYSGSHLSIDATNFKVHLVRGDGPGIHAKRHLTGMAAEAGNASWSVDGDALRLDAKCEGFAPGCGASFEIAVPAKVSVSVRAEAGEVTASDLPNELDIDNTNGKVRLDNTSGKLRIRGTAGELSANGLRSPDVETTSENGPIRLFFAAAPNRVVARSAHAAVTVGLPGDVGYQIAATSDTDAAESKLPNDAGSPRRVEASNVNGGKVLVVPA
ncbi:DUF4097 family beta strand repeat-containing protein [Amycolatopsis minnesotensis]